jgi:aspartate racemase
MAETVKFCRQQFPFQKVYGLLAGTSTVKLGLYTKAFEKGSLKILAPTPEEQKTVLECIYAVKAGEANSIIKPRLLEVVQNLGNMGAEAIILGCTEIPIVLQNGDHVLTFIDATDVLAKAAVARAKT